MQGVRRIAIAGVGTDVLRLPDAVQAILARAGSGQEAAYVVTPNAQHICTFQDDADFRRIYHHAWLSLADGVPLVWAARLLGSPLPGRVNGTDLFVQLCLQAPAHRLRVFLLGGRPGAAAAAAELLRTQAPGLEVGVHCPPLGFEASSPASAACEQAVRAFQPHLLFVGLGSPKQERWISQHQQALGVAVCIGIGVSFELVSGMVPRAPVWMQRCGLEWAFRLMVEPRRLWRRYVLGNPRFLWLVLRQRLHGRQPDHRDPSVPLDAGSGPAAPPVGPDCAG